MNGGMEKTQLIRGICAAAIALGLACCFGLAAAAPASPPQSALPTPSAVAKTTAYVSVQPVPRNSNFEVAVVIAIARGFHMNSHTPTDPYLIPTSIKARQAAGIEISGVSYPKGQGEKFAFSPDKPLDVYTGSVKILLHASAGANAHLGPARLPLTLSYQACNDSACLAPVKVPVNVSFDIAAAGTKAHAIHSEIFAPAPVSR